MIRVPHLEQSVHKSLSDVCYLYNDPQYRSRRQRKPVRLLVGMRASFTSWKHVLYSYLILLESARAGKTQEVIQLLGSEPASLYVSSLPPKKPKLILYLVRAVLRALRRLHYQLVPERNHVRDLGMERLLAFL